MVLEATALIRISSNSNSKFNGNPNSNLINQHSQPNQHNIKPQKKEDYFHMYLSYISVFD